MKLELSHDILAKEIYASMTHSAPELVRLKQKEQYIRTQHAYYREGNRSYLTREELDELAPFLQIAEVTEPERQYVQDSYRAWRRKRRLRNGAIATAVLVILSILSGVLYYAYRARLSEARADEASAYSESVRLSNLAQQEIARGNRHNALLLALHGTEGFPEPPPLLQNALTDAFHLGFQRIPLLMTKLPHGGPVKQFRFSPDGKMILSVSEDKSARLWDANGVLVAALQHDGQTIHDAVFSPDGQTVFTCAADGAVHAWDLQGRRTGSFDLGGETVALSATAARLLALAYDRSVKLYDRNADSLIILSGPPAENRWWAAQFSPDGSQILLADLGGGLTLFDSQGQIIRRGQFADPVDAQRYAFRFSADGPIWIKTPENAGGWIWRTDGQIRSLSANAAPPAGLLPPTDNLREIAYQSRHPLFDTPVPEAVGFKYPLAKPLAAFSPDGERIVSTELGRDSMLFLWSLNSDPIKAVALSREPDPEIAVDFPATLADSAVHRLFPIDEIRWSPAGNRLFTASSYQSKLWSSNLDLIASWPTISGSEKIQFSEDGTLLWMTFALRNGSQDLSVRDDAGRELFRMNFPGDQINAATPTPDARQIAVLLNSGRIVVYSLQEKQIVRQRETKGSPTVGIFSGDGGRLFIGFGDGSVERWDLQEDSFSEVTRHGNNVFDLDLQEERGWLLSAGGDFYARLSTLNGERIRDISMSDYVLEAVFSPSGKHYFVRDQKRQLILLSSDGRDSLVLSAVNPILSARFSPDGEQLLLHEQAGPKQQLRLVDLRGQTLAAYPHPGIITSMTITDEGRRIQSTGESTAWVWLTPSGVLDWLRKHPPAPLSEQERQLYQIDGFRK